MSRLPGGSNHAGHQTPQDPEALGGQMLLKALGGWYNESKYRQQRRGHRHTQSVRKLTKKAHEDERSLCHSDWSTEEQISYGSILLQIQEANQESDSAIDFIRKTFDILGGTIMVTVFLGMLMSIPVAMITIGVKYLTECPKEPKVPVYLLVGGCFAILKLMSVMWKQVRSRRYERLDDIQDYPIDGGGDVLMSKSSRFSDNVLSLFLFIWFCFGNYWVFHIWKPYFVPLLHEPSNWCDRTVYMFSFYTICACYGGICLFIFLVCLLTICNKCSSCCGDDNS